MLHTSKPTLIKEYKKLLWERLIEEGLEKSSADILDQAKNSTLTTEILNDIDKRVTAIMLQSKKVCGHKR